jgi:transposase
VKNRIKAKYREHGITASGPWVYGKEGREAWQKKVGRATVRFMLEMLYQQLDTLEAIRDQLAHRLSGMMRTKREYHQMLGLPGVGDVTASILVAVIADPHRFQNKRKLWKYSGLSVSGPWTGDPSKAHKGGSKSGNRLLKYAAMTAAKAAIRGDNRFARHYTEMIEAGIKPAMAEKTTARNILAAALAVWKQGTEYQDVR